MVQADAYGHYLTLLLPKTI